MAYWRSFRKFTAEAIALAGCDNISDDRDSTAVCVPLNYNHCSDLPPASSIDDLAYQIIVVQKMILI